MVGSFLLVLFIVQVVFIGIIVLVLRKVLDGILIENAVKHFETMKTDENLRKIPEIVVLSSHGLSSAIQNRIQRAVKRNFEAPKVVHKIDKSLKGGIIINLGKSIIDGSLITRWSMMWSHLLGRP
jgi:F0F1-type ATP synthase delta subunit